MPNFDTNWRRFWNGNSKKWQHLMEMDYRSYTEFEKTIVVHSCFLENSENFLNFAKSSKKVCEFFNFLEFSKIIQNFLVFSYAFLNFLDFSRML